MPLVSRLGSAAARAWGFLSSSLKDIYFNYVTLLLNTPTTNTVITDASTNNFNINAVGNSRARNFSPYLTGWSNYFDGTGDYLTTPSNAAFAFGTGDFTIEGWFYFTGTISTYQRPWWFGDDNDNIEINSSVLRVGGASQGTLITGSTTILANTWYHIALTRASGSYKLWLNGTQQGSSASNSYNSSTRTFSIMATSGGSNPSTGYVSNLRIVKGTALYTANFTPSTTPLTAISGTSLLTCQSNRLIDNSSNNLTITKNGDVSVLSFNPFNLTSTNNNGSMYFAGSSGTDYLYLTSNSAWSLPGDFTLEAWVYMTALPNTYIAISVSAVTEGLWFGYLTTGLGLRRYGVADVAQNASAPTLNTWIHIAAVRSSGVVKIYQNGTEVASANYSGTFANSDLIIAADGNPGSSTQRFPGYITDLRIVKGTAVYTSNFTPPTSSLTAISGTSLLTLQTSQGHNNNAFLDTSTNNFLLTRNGNATQGTFSPFSQTGWSNYFGSSTSDNIYAASNSAYAVGTGNFTIEFFLNLTNWSGYQRYVLMGQSGSSPIEISRNSGVDALLVYTNTNQKISYNWSPTLNQWYHIAVVRSGTGANQLTLYINGVSVATGTSSDSISANNFFIGGLNWATGYNCLGYISNLRYSNTARTISVPTQPYTADGNTLLLTCQSNGFIDNSYLRNTITRSGSTSVQAFSPFAPQTSVPTTYSGYFDGSGDYLALSQNSAFTFDGDFTIEFWWYPTNLTPSYQDIIGTANNNSYLGAGAGGWVIGTTSNIAVGLRLGYQYGNSWIIDGSLGVSTLSTNTWYHIAIVRSGSNIKGYLNGTAGSTTFTYASTIQSTTYGPYIGRGAPSSVDSYGYISNVRIVKGTAVYTSNFTPPTTPLTAISGTSLLTCQSSTFIDNSTNAFTITSNGNSVPTQFNPLGFTTTTNVSYSPSTIGGSIYLDGSGDTVTMNNSIITPLTTMTIEGWFYINSSATLQGLWGGGVDLYGINLQYQESANQKLNLFIGTGAAWGAGYVSNTSLYPGQWYHIAYVRSGTTHWLYINGVVDSSINGVTNSVTWSGSTFYIGVPQLTTRYYNGYVTGFRVSNIRRYTANFTPPASITTSDVNTVLLLNGSNTGIYDATSKNDLETVGDAKASTVQYKYLPGSTYFDGTGDYCTISDNPLLELGSGNFTIEAWIYPTATASNQNIFGKGINGQNWWAFYLYTTSLKLEFAIVSGGTVLVDRISNESISLNTWTHVAVCRSGSTFRLFINGTEPSGYTGSPATSSAAVPDLSAVFNIGANRYTGSSDNFNGYIQNLRVTNGIARYTSNFSPSGPFPTS